jgi:hypothetical protein
MELRPGVVRLQVRVQPRARRDQIEGFDAGVLRVRVKAPPVAGEANDAVLRLLAARLQLPRASIKITTGVRSRRKTIEVVGMDERKVWERLRSSEPE